MPAEQIAENGYNLDIKNPNGKKDLEQMEPEMIVESILEKECKIADILAEIKQVLSQGHI